MTQRDHNPHHANTSDPAQGEDQDQHATDDHQRLEELESRADSLRSALGLMKKDRTFKHEKPRNPRKQQ